EELNRIRPSHSGTISLQADPVLSIAGAGENANASGDVNLTYATTILGHGHVIDAGHLDRALAATTDLTLQDLTVQNGTAPAGAEGGGVSSTGTVTATGVSILGNQVNIPSGTGKGGGGVSAKRVVLTRSTASGNQATGQGFGAAIKATASITIDQSLVAENQ